MTSAALANRVRAVSGRLRAWRWGLWHRNVEVGTRAWIGRGCRLRIDPGARLVIGPRCGIDDGSTLAAYGTGRIELGEGSFIGHHCTLAARQLVQVGEGAFLAELVSVRDHDHALGFPPSSGEVSVSPVHIGSKAWMGSKVTVLRGSHIGDGSVVGANAVVRGTLPPSVVAAGGPARVLHGVTVEMESSRWT
jgi:acetyltransferase-like isoleucine patch superfamily enzyme